MAKSARYYSHWYLMALRGIFLIVLGILATFINETTAPIKFAKFFEVFAMVSGLLLIQNALLRRKNKNWQFVLFNGAFDLLYGIILWLVPELDLLDLKVALAIWFLYSGLIQAVNSMVLIHDNIKNWWVELISGMMSIILAFILIAVRIKIQIEVYWLAGLFALIFGIFLVISSFVVREPFDEDD